MESSKENYSVSEIKQWAEEKLKRIINPDDLTWEDLGFEDQEAIKEQLEKFGSIENEMYYGGDIDYDEFNQAQLQLLEELLEKLKEI
jgi:hypothetical protein